MVGSIMTLTGVLIGAAVFVILFVVLSVTLWVSIVAGVAAMLLWGAVGSAGVGATHRRSAPGRG